MKRLSLAAPYALALASTIWFARRRPEGPPRSRAPKPPKQSDRDAQANAERLAALEAENRELRQSRDELLLACDQIVEGWALALDLRDNEPPGHSLGLADLTVRMGRLAGLSDEELVQARRGALLHDIGKLGIPDAILLKPGPLSRDEWAIVRRHPSYAYELLQPTAYLQPALDIPYCHHEKWDGSGYPRQLKGEAIPLAARLFAVVDVWDALCSKRPFRQPWPAETVRLHIAGLAGSHFDPRAVEVLFQVIDGASSEQAVTQSVPGAAP